ncbi:uncharacterized protein BXZ73DRAFT_73187 [Epithele typhae]|uniref:uncharacterized protein n=1 Tax=Epithele typhae TaxID=378194 RepID=UPI00200775FE|nr:uncharacterized protein BXZ73DRAFT_73187 [Epithele typhae]KAH9944941.1 hypothetical protein BXZ73DRAFT_73187 [Epithele typhae]
MDHRLAIIHRVILCVDAPEEVQNHIDLINATPDLVLPRYAQVYLRWERGIEASNEELLQLRQLLRMVSVWPTVHKLSLDLPKNTPPDVLKGIVFRGVKQLIYDGPASTVYYFLRQNPSITTLTLFCPPIDAPTIFGIARFPSIPFRHAPLLDNITTLACPVGCLKGLSFPLFRLEVLYLELKDAAGIPVSRTCVARTLRDLSPKIFPRMNFLYVHMGPGDRRLVKEIPRLFPKIYSLCLIYAGRTPVSSLSILPNVTNVVSCSPSHSPGELNVSPSLGNPRGVMGVGGSRHCASWSFWNACSSAPPLPSSWTPPSETCGLKGKLYAAGPGSQSDLLTPPFTIFSWRILWSAVTLLASCRGGVLVLRRRSG